MRRRTLLASLAALFVAPGLPKAAEPSAVLGGVTIVIETDPWHAFSGVRWHKGFAVYTDGSIRHYAFPNRPVYPMRTLVFDDSELLECPKSS